MMCAPRGLNNVIGTGKRHAFQINTFNINLILEILLVFGPSAKQLVPMQFFIRGRPLRTLIGVEIERLPNIIGAVILIYNACFTCNGKILKIHMKF